MIETQTPFGFVLSYIYWRTDTRKNKRKQTTIKTKI